MDKAQAIHKFWSLFQETEKSGSVIWQAYDEYSVPDGAKYPYITYNVSTDSLGHPLPLTASLWDRNTSWKRITEKADQVSELIGYGYHTEKADDGYLYIVRGSAFAQRMNDPNDDSVKRIYLNIIAEFLTS